VKKHSTYNCPACNTLHTITLELASLLICKNCGEIIQDGNSSDKPPRTRIPEDWSFLRIGSTGEFNKQPFKIIGRVRIQLRNDYKNFWSADNGRGECLWLMESFGSFAVFTSPWREYDKDASKLRAGNAIPVSSDVKLIGDYVEKSEGVSYEGELGPWKLFRPGFFLIQASANGNTAVFLVNKGNAEYLIGTILSLEDFKFQNIITWNEWK